MKKEESEKSLTQMLQENEAKRSLLRLVEEIEEQGPEALVTKYNEEFLRAIRYLIGKYIGEEEEEDDSYYDTPEGIYAYFEKRQKDRKNKKTFLKEPSPLLLPWVFPERGGDLKQ